MKIIIILSIILATSCTIYWDVPSTKNTTVSPAPSSMKPLYCEDRPSRCPYGD